MTTANIAIIENFESPEHSLDALLQRRMQRPQRHRLLHGYPLHTGMRHITMLKPERRTSMAKSRRILEGQKRGVLVGVLPHPFCNPAVRGCGYCTFPHQQYRRSEAEAVVNSVIKEISSQHTDNPEMDSVPVRGLYFGGGTANLTPVESLEKLSKVLNSRFDLSQAEITLEGVPAYFLKRNRPLDILQKIIDAGQFRISMGIQSFDPRQLERMGRQAFGNAETFANVVKYAHSAGIMVSGDLLFNLPGQTLNDMREDLSRAIEIGLDQICLYHLVLVRGMGTEWSRNPDLLAKLPSNTLACQNWQVLRWKLLAAGYVQTTLTNFERADVESSSRQFIYENLSFQPDQFDMLGFGPSGISFSANNGFTRGIKLVNSTSAEDYQCREIRWDQYHDYDETDLKVFYLTRRLAGLSIDTSQYKAIFKRNIWRDFGERIQSLVRAGLVALNGDHLKPTPVGMFYADTIASLFVDRAKRAQEPDSNVYGHM